MLGVYGNSSCIVLSYRSGYGIIDEIDEKLGVWLYLVGVKVDDIGDRLEKGVSAGSAHKSSDVEWSVSVWVISIVEGVGDGGTHGSAHNELC